MIPEYRAWLKDEDKMVKVSSINYKEETIKFFDQENRSKIENETLVERVVYIRRTVDFTRIILMQSRGLLDQEAVKIFEDDIVSFEEHYDGDNLVRAVVARVCIHEEEWALFSLKDGKDEYIGDLYSGHLNWFLKVIGNTHANIELMTEKITKNSISIRTSAGSIELGDQCDIEVKETNVTLYTIAGNVHRSTDPKVVSIRLRGTWMSNDDTIVLQHYQGYVNPPLRMVISYGELVGMDRMVKILDIHNSWILLEVL